MFAPLLRPTTAVLLVLFAESAVAAPFVPVRDPQCVAFSPSGKLVATGCSGMSDGGFPPRPHPDVRKCGVVAIWDIASGKRLRRIETFGDLTKIAFSPDGTLLAACRLYSTSDGVALHEVRLWDASSGQVVQTLDRCHAFDFSPDGRSIAVASRTRCVVYDLADWTKERLVEPLGGAVTLAYAADGQRLCGICRVQGKYLIRACDVAAGKTVRESLPLGKPFYHLALSPDGQWLATGHDEGEVLVWRQATLEPHARLQMAQTGIAHPFFSTDSQKLAAGSQEKGDVVIWDLATRTEERRFTFDKGSFRTYHSRRPDDPFRPEKDPARFAFSPDGQSFVVGAYGGIVRLVEDGRDIQRFGE